jgi:hypothetical protein
MRGCHGAKCLFAGRMFTTDFIQEVCKRAELPEPKLGGSNREVLKAPNNVIIKQGVQTLGTLGLIVPCLTSADRT